MAYDALSILVNRQNTWAQCLTTAQLKSIWEPNAKVNYWKDLNPAWPNRRIVLFGAGTDSGTFDYFTEAIMGRAGSIRKDYFPSEDDNVIMRGVTGNPYAMAFVGFAYYEENKDKVKAVAIDHGKGCVLPSRETVLDGTYQPLSRPLFIYVNVKSLDRPGCRPSWTSTSPPPPGGPSAPRGTWSCPTRPTASARAWWPARRRGASSRTCPLAPPGQVH